MTTPRVQKGQRWKPKKLGQPIEVVWTSGEVAEVENIHDRASKRLTVARIRSAYELVPDQAP